MSSVIHWVMLSYSLGHTMFQSEGSSVIWFHILTRPSHHMMATVKETLVLRLHSSSETADNVASSGH